MFAGPGGQGGTSTEVLGKSGRGGQRAEGTAWSHYIPGRLPQDLGFSIDVMGS